MPNVGEIGKILALVLLRKNAKCIIFNNCPRKISRRKLGVSHLRGENRMGRFTGASKYVLDEELAQIVNITMALEMPLLLKGEPGFIAEIFPYSVWINPKPAEQWPYTHTISIIREMFPMFELNLDGLENAVAYMMRKH
jgi:hypothetical protein